MRFLFVLLLGAVLGAAAMYMYDRDFSGVHHTNTAASYATTDSARDAADRAMAKTRATASDVSDAVSEKMQAWHLTPTDIRADLAKGGEVVRQNTARAREKVADVRIVAVIKAKFVLDRDLSATAIAVDSTDGNVTLTGTVASDALIGKAVAHALDTDGVTHVASKLTVGSR